MKKLFKILLLASLSLVSAICVIGCKGASSWDGTSLKNWGAVVSNGGFVAETENYVYFINGVATYTDDNTFGAPVKGSLAGISKTDLASGNLDKAEIVVPKLFAATDYNAGLFIDGDYVYYGTPSTAKDSSGIAASSYLAFQKTKLDGTDTQNLFTISGLSTEYRIVKAGETVYIVYYDTTDKTLCEFNTSTKKIKEIAKTDDTAEVESLKDYKFVENVNGGITLLYSVTVYAEPYYAEKAEDTHYSRATESYNVMYSYTPGQNASVVKNGKAEKVADNKTYAVTYADGEYVFFTETDVNAKETVYGVNVNDIGNWIKIENKDALKETTYIVDPSNVYMFDNDSSIIYKTTLTGNDASRRTVAKTRGVNSIVNIDGKYAYCYDTANMLCRVELSNEDALTQIISNDTVATTYYKPGFVTISEKQFIIYIDNSSMGNSYPVVMNLTDATVETQEATDEQSAFDYLVGNKYLAIRKTEDQASFVKSSIDSASKSSELKYTTTDEGVIFTEAQEVISLYENSSDEVKKLIDSTYQTKIENYKKAIALSEKYYKLKSVKDYEGTSEKDALKTPYEEAKAYRQKLIDEDCYEAVRTLTPTEFKWYYQQTNKIFE